MKPRNKTTDKLNVQAMLDHANLDEKQVRSLVAKLNIKRRWDKTTKAERKAWGQKLTDSRKAKKSLSTD